MSALPTPLPDPRDDAAAMTAARLAAWRRFLEAHARVTDVLTRELRERDDLSLSWYDVLVQLSEAPARRLRMQELADAVLLSKSGVTRLVDRMEREGLVTRVACADDGRGTYAELTDAGMERLRRAYPVHLVGVMEHFAGLLDDDEASVLAELLGRIAHAGRLA